LAPSRSKQQRSLRWLRIPTLRFAGTYKKRPKAANFHLTARAIDLGFLDAVQSAALHPSREQRFSCSSCL
jgi:hypothetical protein